MNSSSRGRRAMLLLPAIVLAGCSRPARSDSKPAPPAKVAQIASEEQLNTITLTAEAEARLGLETAAVESRRVARRRTFGGEATLPTGASLVVSAPVSGRLKLASTDAPLSVGQKVARRYPIFVLTPLLSPERDVMTPAERIAFAQAQMQLSQARVDAEGQVQQTRVQVDAAKIALDRAERLLREQAGNAKTVDDARAQLELAQKTLDAAATRKRLVDGIQLDAEAGKVEPLVIEAPQAGIIRAEFVAPGQVAPAGAPLFEIANFDPIWIRVPVYAGEVSEVALQAPAQVKSLADAPAAPGIAAQPVSAPPTAVPQAAAVDLYYELPNGEGKFRPGQRVSATLTLDAEQESLGVPWSAVVQDIYGGAWVYERTAERTYVRRRVEVPYVIGEWAVLAAGPPAGARVVTAGVAELFGTEFGFGK